MSDNPPSTIKEKLKICPSCGVLFDIGFETCPSCGSPLIDFEPDMSLPTHYQPSSIEAHEIESSTFSVQEGPPIDLKELHQKINILWEERKAKQAVPSTLIFPEHVKKVTPREILNIISDIQKCYHHNVPNACPGLLRKTLFSAIKIKFYMEKQKDDLYDTEGNRKGNWIDTAKQKGYLSQELAKELKRAKIFGDIGVHDERIKFDKSEVAEIFLLLRYVIECMYATN